MEHPIGTYIGFVMYSMADKFHIVFRNQGIAFDATAHGRQCLVIEQKPIE